MPPKLCHVNSTIHWVDGDRKYCNRLLFAQRGGGILTKLHTQKPFAQRQQMTEAIHDERCGTSLAFPRLFPCVCAKKQLSVSVPFPLL